MKKKKEKRGRRRMMMMKVWLWGLGRRACGCVVDSIFVFCLMMIESMMKILSSFHSKPNMMAAVLSWNWLLLMVPYGELI